ncbi:MAG TPA: flagellar motor protein MotB [Bryobacteraceae bacterium]|nr:flagellar motor protein MotB [Bryobacteraceae bacterium]
MAETRPIIIKKKNGHAGHHGGAWKVAYADFVTAMMALFIVLWLLNTKKEVREAVGGYFRDPSGTSKNIGSGKMGSGESFTVTKDNMGQLKEELQKAVQQVSKFDQFKNQIEMTITSEGLRIELLENEAGTFFPSGIAEPTESGKDILIKLSDELSKLPNKLSIEGHTDARPFVKGAEYGNWELSSDRANAARRIMQAHGIGTQQVTQVRGYADQRLRKPEAPEDASNRRISLIVQYLVKEQEEAPAAVTHQRTTAAAAPPAAAPPAAAEKPAASTAPPAAKPSPTPPRRP